MFAKLQVIAGPDSGRCFELVANVPLVVGRSREADARLTDPKASAFHCRLQTVKGCDMLVTDLDSRTGTSVNGTFVLEHNLIFGDIVQIGDTKVRVLDPDEEISLPGATKAETGSSSSSATLPKLGAKAEGSKEHEALPARVDLLVGKVLGQYAIDGILGRARTGLVFNARHTKSNREVALKVINPTAMQGAGATERFTSTIKAVLPLRHPKVVTVSGAGKTGAYFWVAMEKVQGDSLTQFIRKKGVAGMLDWRRALRMSVYLARGMNYIHEQQVIYGNVGPQNILVDEETGIPRFGDLLRSRSFEAVLDGSYNAEELPDDLLSYLAPEQTRDASECDYRADIFSLGSMCYQLLTGHPPFEGGSIAETVTKIRREKPEVLKKYQLAIPEALQGVILQMLAKRPEDRYQSTAELLKEMERVLKYQAITL